MCSVKKVMQMVSKTNHEKLCVNVKWMAIIDRKSCLKARGGGEKSLQKVGKLCHKCEILVFEVEMTKRKKCHQSLEGVWVIKIDNFVIIEI